LNHYTGKNTTDYFIHKDLKSFLQRELEYYLKNEVIRVDDFIADQSQQAMEVALTRAKVVRHIGQKIIAFLSQIENFQKKLFEKRKFVVDTHYCFTLDKVPEELYDSILENEEQLQNWVELYAMDKWKGELQWDDKWTKAFLKEHPFMMVDTRFFDEDFKFELLSGFKNLDFELTGLLVNGENFQALKLMNSKFRNKIDGIYIDPPYNTKSSEILYKNSFKHSSWLSLLENRIEISKEFLQDQGLFTVTIDDYEVPNLWMLLYEKFGRGNHLGTAAIRINPGGRKSKRKLAAQHEYAIFFAKNENTEVSKIQVDPEDKSHSYKQDENRDWYEERNLRKEGKDSFGDEDANRYYPIYFDPETGKISSKEKLEIEILPIDTNGQKRIWRRGIEDIDDLFNEGDIFYKKTKYGHQIYFRFRGGAFQETPKSFWEDAKFSASEHGTQKLLAMMGREVFSYPKSPYAVEECLNVLSDKKNALFLDYFAGSGTTAEAVIRMNKLEKGSDRKFILVEMGQYFGVATLPRVKKSLFSRKWDNAVPRNKDGLSGGLKYHLIESYEDALNNIDFKNPEDTQQAMEFEDYMLHYMLDFETQGVSATLLKEKAFETPFNYQLNIQRGHDSPKPESVDMVETFHYLIGLWVQTLRRHEHQKRKYVVSKGQIRNEDATEEVCVIWRKTKDLD
jgi:adenine-specific DNA-methyltransferase